MRIIMVFRPNFIWVIVFILTFPTCFYSHELVPAKEQTKSTLILGATTHIGDGTVIENAAIGFKNGKILLVKNIANEPIEKTNFDTIIDAKGKHVYPGFIAVSSTLGLTEVDAVRATRDFAEVGLFNANVRSIVAYNTDSKIIPTIRSNGILLAQITPQGGFISGTSSVVELDGWNWEDASYKIDDAIHINWPTLFKNNGWWAEPGVSEKNKEYEKQINSIKKIFSDTKAYAESDKSEKNLPYESLSNLFTGSQKLFIHAFSEKEIIDAVSIAKSSGIKEIVLVTGSACTNILDFIKQNSVDVVLVRLHSLPNLNEDEIDIVFKTPYLLNKAGINCILSDIGDMEPSRTRNLPFIAGTAAAYGLSKEEALKCITLNAAKILGINTTVGSIAVGKDATLLLSSGDALDMKSNNIESAYIRGKLIDLNNSQKELFEKYKAKNDKK